MTSPIANDFSTSPLFPATLPGCILTAGFTYGPMQAVIRFPVATGLHKQRNRYTAVPWTMTGNIIVDLTQKNTLDAFIKDTLASGSLPFRKADPVATDRTWLWEFMKPLTYTPWQPNLFITTLQLMRIPSTMQYDSSAFRLVDAVQKPLTDSNSVWLRG